MSDRPPTPLSREKLIALLQANYDAYASDDEGLSPLGWNAIRSVLPQVIHALQSEKQESSSPSAIEPA